MVFDIKVGEKPQEPTNNEKAAKLREIIEAYKVRNPEKAAKKETEFTAKLAKLQGAKKVELPVETKPEETKKVAENNKPNKK